VSSKSRFSLVIALSMASAAASVPSSRQRASSVANCHAFPNEESLERLVSAVLVEIDERWAVDTKAYIKWECQDA